MPGGVWSYDKLSPLAAVRNIAAAAGAVVISHPWDLLLQVRPRYPVSPWAWLTSAPDVYIQDDLILRDSLRPASKPVYDYVLVSGQQRGVSDPIIRTGAAGELRAGMIVDPLITQHDVALERGQIVACDPDARQLSETGVDAIDRIALGNDARHRGGACVDRIPSPCVQCGARAFINRAPVGEPHGAGVDDHRPSLMRW